MAAAAKPTTTEAPKPATIEAGSRLEQAAGKLFATAPAYAPVEPTQDEAKAAAEPVVAIKPLERSNALRSYLGNKITMARAGAFNMIPNTWRDKWKRVVDVFGGSGLHGWQFGAGLGLPVHYNELNPDVFTFQQLIKTTEGGDQIKRVWNPIAEQIAKWRLQNPKGGYELHQTVNKWWKSTIDHLRREDATPAERATAILMENSIGTMGNTQALMDKNHKWKKGVASLGDVSALFDKHRLNTQIWEGMTNEAAQDLMPKLKPGDMVLLDPPYALTKKYEHGGELSTIPGAVKFIDQVVAPAVDRGISIVYTNSAHIPIVEALRKAGMETRIERVHTQQAGGDLEEGEAAWRYEVVGWTKDVSPPRATSMEVLKGLIKLQNTGQIDFTGQTTEDVWNTLVRASADADQQNATYEATAAAQEAKPEEAAAQPSKPQKGTVEHARANATYSRNQAVHEIANHLTTTAWGKAGGDLADEETLRRHAIERTLRDTNGRRLEVIMALSNTAEREAMLKEIPEFTLQNLQKDVDALLAKKGVEAKKVAAVAKEEPAEDLTDYVPQKGDQVSWTDADGNTLEGKIVQIMPSEKFKVKVETKGYKGEKRPLLAKDTKFTPAEKVLKPSTERRVRYDPNTDSMTKAIIAFGGVRTDKDGRNAGEIASLREAGIPGLVNEKSEWTVENMAMKLAESGYGQNVWWEGNLSDPNQRGVDGAAMLDAAINDAAMIKRRGKGIHFSTEAEQTHEEMNDAEREYRESLMSPEEITQWRASEKFEADPKAKALLKEVADGKATQETYTQLSQLAAKHGVDEENLNTIVRFAGELQDTDAEASVGHLGPTEGTTGTERSPLDDEEIPFRRRLPQEPEYLKDPETGVPAFFSQLYRTIVDKLPNRASLEQLRKIIQSPQNGVKADEVKWTGFDDFLDKHPPGVPVTKDDVLEYLRANALDIHEIRKEEDPNNLEDKAGVEDMSFGQFDRHWNAVQIEPSQEDLEEYGEPDADQQELEIYNGAVGITIRGSRDAGWFVTWDEANTAPLPSGVEIANTSTLDQAKAAAYDAYQNHIDDVRVSMGDTESQYEQYVLSGPSENYQEQVYTVPLQTPTQVREDEAQIAAMIAKKKGIVDQLTAISNEKGFTVWPLNDRAIAKLKAKEIRKINTLNSQLTVLDTQMARIRDRRPSYTSGHWQEEDAMGHSRTTNREDVDGKHGLLVEEVQADLHQEAHAAYKTFREALSAKYDVDVDQVESKASDREKEILALRGYSSPVAMAGDSAEIQEALKGPPQAPFEKNWHEFIMRRLIHKAVNEGAERVYWTTGDQQIERWSEALRQKVSAIVWEKIVGVRKDISTPDMRPRPLKTDTVRLTVYPTDGSGEQNMNVPLRGRATIQNREVSLDDVVGKKLAKAIREGDDAGGRFEGDDLNIGGEGMIQFYDRMLGSFMKKFGAKFGAQTGDTEIKASNAPGWEVLDEVGNWNSHAVFQHKEHAEQFAKDMTAHGLVYANAMTHLHDLLQNGQLTTKAFADLEKQQTRGKPHPVKLTVEKADVPTHTVHYMDISPAMVESVEGGTPLFRRREEQGHANPATHKGNDFFIGTVNTQDGQIENTYTHAEASRSDFHHGYYMKPADVDGLADGSRIAFWIDKENRIRSWLGLIDGKLRRQIENQITLKTETEKPLFRIKVDVDGKTVEIAENETELLNEQLDHQLATLKDVAAAKPENYLSPKEKALAAIIRAAPAG